MVGEQVPANGTLVARADISRTEMARIDDCLGGESPRQQRLPDSFTSHHVGGSSRIADEQCPARGERDSVDGGRNRPRSVPILEFDLRSEGGSNVRAAKEVGPQRLEVLSGSCSITRDTESDVDPVVW